MIITVRVNARTGQAMGIKEDLALYLERYGDAKVISIQEEDQGYQQLEIGGGYGKKQMSRMRR